MFRWNSKQIKSDLAAIDQVSRVDITGPGGAVDTENLVIYLKGTDQMLWACGFAQDEAFYEIPYEEKGDIDVEMVELDDGLDSRGGLNSTDPIVALAYVAVRQYFIDKDVDVVDDMDDYF